ncbi:hypothetical protein FGB62_96g110 [Gracilaria domingensis]|nr:hypothetical protein FGB62_96g110 [Gracilaria domingensis]
MVYFERLDVFATVGANSPLYLRVDDIESAGGQISVVIRRIEGRQNPFLSAMVIKPLGVTNCQGVALKFIPPVHHITLMPKKLRSAESPRFYIKHGVAQLRTDF